MATVHKYSAGRFETQRGEGAISALLCDYGFRVMSTFVAQPSNQQTTVFRLSDHLDRLCRSAEELAISSDIPEHNSEFIKQRLADALNEFVCLHPQMTQLRTRLILGANELTITIDEYTPRWLPGQQVRLRTVKVQRPLARHKLLGAPVSVFATRFASAHGYHEALLLDDNEHPLEGAWSNFFWFDHNGKLFTPEGALLPGVTRKAIMELRPVTTVLCPLADILRSASEFFITQSTSGITPVCAIDDYSVGRASAGLHTQELRRDLEQLILETSTQLNGR